MGVTRIGITSIKKRFRICNVFSLLHSTFCVPQTYTTQSNDANIYSDLDSEGLQTFLANNKKLQAFLQQMVQFACNRDLESYCNLISTTPEEKEWCINGYTQFLASNNYLCGLKLYTIKELVGKSQIFYFTQFYFESNPDQLFYCG